VCDFVDEVPDDIFRRLTHAGQVAFEPVNPASGVKTRLKAQYYVMAMHSMSLANALALFKVCAWQQSLPAVALLQVLLVFFVDHDFWMLECLVSSLVVQLGITKLFLVGFKLLLPGCFLVFSDYLLSFC
jgi:hypothetical protein